MTLPRAAGTAARCLTIVVVAAVDVVVAVAVVAVVVAADADLLIVGCGAPGTPDESTMKSAGRRITIA